MRGPHTINKMQILFLGTSSMVPTKERNQSGVLISYKNEGILIDCGEGTQRQLKIAGVKLTKITKILISHWHGDHVLGLTGLIQSMNAAGYDKKLEIYGPKGSKVFIKRLFQVFKFARKMNIEVIDVNRGKFFENDDFILEAQPLKHNVDTLGYSLNEKGKRKITFITSRFITASAHGLDAGARVRCGRLLSPQTGVPAPLKRSLPANPYQCESV